MCKWVAGWLAEWIDGWTDGNAGDKEVPLLIEKLVPRVFLQSICSAARSVALQVPLNTLW